ncbi:MAG: LysM peptidoglycan-binding domain-containing protein [Bacteroidales bacterium]|nr:LysM peptidoglycan-binding domain-containing protein [Bacteroidales bacterium]
MLIRTIKKYVIAGFVGIAALAAADELRASTPVIVDTVKAHLVIPRPAVDPVPSLFRSPSDPVDTLDTAHEHIKVVLYGDQTWHYYKTPEYQDSIDVFGEYWKTSGANPYGIELSEMPDQWAIWCVDSLDQYHCPFQGEVYHRGKFGMRRGRRHQGVDLPLKTGEPIYATFTGKVRVSKNWSSYGNMVIIRHENGIETFYAHLSKRLVEAGDWVNAGDVIGYGGSTGRSSGPHLHFETRYKGFAFDPQWLIDFKTGELRHRLFVLKKKYFDIYSNYEQDFEDEARNEEEDKKEDAEREAMRWYTIKSGDTLGGIAYRNGTTVKELCRLNGIKADAILKIGKKIRVR